MVNAWPWQINLPTTEREHTMTITVTLPTTPQPYLDQGLLPADFYSYEELLSDSERAKIHRIREFLRTEAAPIVDEYWARAEFPSSSSRDSPSWVCWIGPIPIRRSPSPASC